jgi:hypothetical protein
MDEKSRLSPAGFFLPSSIHAGFTCLADDLVVTGKDAVLHFQLAEHELGVGVLFPLVTDLAFLFLFTANLTIIFQRFLSFNTYPYR